MVSAMGRSEGLREEDSRPAWEQRSLDRVGRQALRRSHEIIEAARELVAEGGLEAVTLRPLLERSGLSRRAFYDRFEGMDDVFLALFEDTMARGAAGIAKRIAKVEGAPAKIEVIVRSMASAARNPSKHRMWILAMSSQHVRLAERRPEELQEAIRPMNDLTAQILAEGMEEGTIRSADPDSLAETLHALVAAEVHRNLHRDRRGKRWIDELCEFCLHGIEAH
jgi:AcrR family transcriptional regulator